MQTHGFGIDIEVVLIVVDIPQRRLAGVRDVACTEDEGPDRMTCERSIVPLPCPSLGEGSPILPAGGWMKAEEYTVNIHSFGQLGEMATFVIALQMLCNHLVSGRISMRMEK